MGSQAREIIWSPQAGPQKALIDCPFPEIFYGGARGGGKTDGVLGKYAIKAETYGPAFNAIFFRKELPMLDDAIERSNQIYSQLGAIWNDQKKLWRFPSGGRLRFRPLERVQDADKYQGQNISDACVEEAGIYADSRAIDRLNGVLRSVSGTPTQLILTGNPGGAGQHWIKKRYIDPAPAGMKILKRPLPNGADHKYVFIPSKVQNNKLLLANDPDYINRLYLVGSDQLVKAWLNGDWNAVEGAFFDCWEESMVIRPFTIPSHWTRFRAFDWGSAAPFSVGWWAIAGEDYEGIPRGAMVRYREWYGAVGPNKGLKITAAEVARGIIEREDSSEKINYSVADPAIFAEDGGPSIAERMANQGVCFSPADNKRVSRNGAMGGWDQMRSRMKDNMLFTFSTCADSIRTIPSLQHDINKPEDLDTKAEDHCFVAGTIVDTYDGAIAIEKLPKSGKVNSVGGIKSYRGARMTKENADVIELKFSNGVSIKCTPMHRFMIDSDEWRYAKDLLGESLKYIPPLSVKPSKSLAESDITCVGNISRKAGIGCIGECGNSITEKFRTGIMSIIKTMTGLTTKLTTSTACLRQIIFLGVTQSRPLKTAERQSARQERLPRFGISQKKEESGTLSITKETSEMSMQKRTLKNPVRFARRNISQLSQRRRKASIAIKTAKPVRCVSVEDSGKADVYCITVPDGECFSIEGGIVVHNCADEWRYACMSRPYISNREVTTRKDTWDEAFEDNDEVESWKTA